MRIPTTIICASVCLAGCATTTTPSEVWVVTRDVDPVTDHNRCTVTAPDRSRGRSFTRLGALYPFVEMNSDVGLLVGVASGGQYRIPPGDIVWRVDRHPHHSLSAADTPVIGASSSPLQLDAMTPEARAIYEQSAQMTAGFMSSLQNGITAAGGDKAIEMLAEMRAGAQLVFRAAAAAPAAGPSSAGTYRVGQITADGVAPIPLDASFDNGLLQCGIELP